MMWLDNLKIFFRLKYLYIYLAAGFMLMPFYNSTQYINILSMIGTFGFIILYYQERIIEKIGDD